MKALYSGVSGMRSHQTKMDVIGNNIANVNTNGYKSQRVTFRDVYYQQIKSPGAGVEGERGGTNSSQVGYGAQVGSIDTMHSGTGYSPTNSFSDLYINGDGYFMVQNASGEQFLTRYGAFHFDPTGNLVDSNGSLVLGLNKSDAGTVDPDGVITGLTPITIENFDDYKNISINSDGTITGYNIKAAAGTEPIETIGRIGIAYVPNQSALILEGNSYYSESNNTGDIITYSPGLGQTGELVAFGLEMSNVDLANEFSDMIITQRGFQANTKIITVVDQMLEELVNLKR